MRRSVGTAVAVVLLLAGCTSSTAVTIAPTGLGPGLAWHLAFNGYGHAWSSTQRGVTRITLQPAQAASRAQTHAALVLSRDTWRDLDAEIRLRTNRQLRWPHPNPWEVGWILWHYTSNDRFYYIALKPNGWELGKEDPDYPGDQRFLASAAQPVFPPGRWYTIRVQQRGAGIEVDVDGRRLVRFTDSQDPYRSGRVGLYTEDASVTFQPVTVGPAS
jgi:Domain of Unknown Function (DUF1080)